MFDNLFTLEFIAFIERVGHQFIDTAYQEYV